MFGAVKLTKHTDIDQYKYSGYGIGFDRKEFFLLGNEIDKNIIIFGVGMSSSPHIDSKKKDTLILGKGPTQGLEHTLTAEKLYSINFNKFIQACIIMEQIVIYLLMVQKLLNLKQQILEL